MRELDAPLRLAIKRLLVHGDFDEADRTLLTEDWTNEKEELFQRCSAHARSCRKGKAQTLAHSLCSLLAGIKATDPKNAGYIQWVLELAGKLPTEEDRAAFNSMFNALLGDVRIDAGLRQRMLESVEKFEWLYTALFPLIGRQVRTPKATGILLAVFAGQCEIRQHGTNRTYRVPPYEIYLDETELTTGFGSEVKDEPASRGH